MNKKANLEIMHNRTMQILTGKTVDEVYNDYMAKVETYINLADEKSIRNAIETIDNFKYFLNKRYYKEKNISESLQIAYNMKLGAIRAKLFELLFAVLRENFDENKQKNKLNKILFLKK